MSSGLASPQSMVVEQQQQPVFHSSVGTYALESHEGWAGSDDFLQNAYLLPPTTPPSEPRQLRLQVPAEAPLPTAQGLASIRSNNGIYGASTPTMTSSSSEPRATSPPVLQQPQRRLSLVASEGFVHNTSTTLGSNQNEDSTPSIGFRSENINESDSYASMPALESLTNSASNTSRSNDDDRRVGVSSFFELLSNSTSSSSPSRGTAVASISMFLANSSDLSRRAFDGARENQSRDISQRGPEGSGSSAAEVIARHRNRAAQAAREADEAQAAEEASRRDTEVSPARRRSSRIAHQIACDEAASLPNTHRDDVSEHSGRRSSEFSSRITSDTDLSRPTSATRKRRAATVLQIPESEDSLTTRTDAVDESPSFPSNCTPPKKKQRRPSSPNLKKPPPSNSKGKSNGSQPKDQSMAETCAICMCEPSREEMSTVNGCKHSFCFTCIGKWSDRENTCPLCKARFSKISRTHQQRRKSKGGPSVHNIKKVKQRDQRSDIVAGAALEGLLASYVAGNGLPPGLSGRLVMATRMGSGILPLLQQHREQVTAAANRSYNSTSNRQYAHFTLDNVFGDSSSDDDETPGAFFPSFMSFFGRRSNRNTQESSNTTASASNNSAQNEPTQFPFSFGSATASSSRDVNGATSLSTTAFRSSSTASGSSSATPAGSLNLYNLRSYALNVSDPLAGHGPSNPLEIDDDSDSDDSVEVVQVVATSTSSI